MTTVQRAVLAGVAAAVLVVGVLAAIVAGTRDDGSDEAAATTVPTTVASAPAPTTGATTVTTAAPTSTSAAAACPAGGPTPRGTVVPDAADMDGDGAPDTVYLTDADDEPAIGVVLAGGHVTEASHERNITSIAYGPFDVDGDGRREIFVEATGNTASTNTLQVFLLDGCELVAARNQEGEPYTFLVTRDETQSGHQHAGVGCVDVDGDGTDDLVGLTGDTSADGTRVHWTRTEVQLHGAELRNAGTQEGDFVVGQDDTAIAQLAQFTCGADPLPRIAND